MYKISTVGLAMTNSLGRQNPSLEFDRIFQLLVGVTVFGGSCLLAGNYISFNSTPDFLKSVKYSSITPKSGQYRTFGASS
jgi:hypothetical protein